MVGLRELGIATFGIIGTILVVRVLAQGFIDGTHIRNDDTVAHVISYEYSVMTTAICDVREPTAGIRNGLGPAADREVPGFEVLSRESVAHGTRVKIRASVAPNTEVPCLCVTGCAVEVIDVGKVEAAEGATVVIADRKLQILP